MKKIRGSERFAWPFRIVVMAFMAVHLASTSSFANEGAQFSLIVSVRVQGFVTCIGDYARLTQGGFTSTVSTDGSCSFDRCFSAGSNFCLRVRHDGSSVSIDAADLYEHRAAFDVAASQCLSSTSNCQFEVVFSGAGIGVVECSRAFWGPFLGDQDGYNGSNSEPLFSYGLTESENRQSLRYTFCREDFDASGEIDFGDLSLLFLFWGGGNSGYWPRIDLDESGEHDGGDLAMLLLSMGQCGQ